MSKRHQETEIGQLPLIAAANWKQKKDHCLEGGNLHTHYWKHEATAESLQLSQGFVLHTVLPQVSPEARPHN